jgi:hypothetical protein
MKSWLIARKHIVKQKVFNPPKIKHLNKVLFWPTKSEVLQCESFLGIDPHWVLWKFLFHLCPSVSLSENPKLGGAIVSVRSESHYLEFQMAQSVQGWRQKMVLYQGPEISRL